MAPQVAVMWLATTSTMMRTPYLCAVSHRLFRSDSVPITQLPMVVSVGWYT